MSNRIFLSPPWTDDAERGAVASAFDSGYIAPCGPMVNAFEDALFKSTGLNAAVVASGTAAIDLLMNELGVDSQTVVIAPTLTFIATVGPAFHRGAQIVFVDSECETGLISIPLLEKALQENENAKNLIVIGVDLFGQCCDYDSIEELCRKYGAKFILDSAESVGATYKGRASGTAGIASVYSFNGNKIITTSGGGAVLSNDSNLIARVKSASQQSRVNVPWFEHERIGYNYRMSNILAAIGCAQLKKLSQIILRKRKIFDFYQEFLNGIAVPFPCPEYSTSTKWLSVFIFKDKEAAERISSNLTSANIECRPIWKPLHMQPVFKNDTARCCSRNLYKSHDGCVAEDFFEKGLCLPSGAGLTNDDLNRISAILQK